MNHKISMIEDDNIQWDIACEKYKPESLVGQLVSSAPQRLLIAWNDVEAYYVPGSQIENQAKFKCVDISSRITVLVVTNVFVCPEPREGSVILEVMNGNQCGWVDALDLRLLDNKS